MTQQTATRTGPASKPGGRPKQRVLAIDACGLAVCAALAAGFYIFSVEPLQEARSGRNALFAELEPRLERVSSLENQTRHQQEMLRGIGEQIAGGELQLRAVDQINHRLSELTSEAAEFELQLEEVKPGSPVTMQWFITMPIRLTGSGAYPDIGAFLHALPSTFPDVAVVGLEVRGEPEQLEREPRFVLNLVWYAAPRSQVGAR